MPSQVKRGKYEKFNMMEAQWVCPNCKHDTLKLSRINEKQLSFACSHCKIDTKDYAITMTDKSTFNSVHRWLTREWSWIRYITEKFYMNGAVDVLSITGD